MSKNEELLAALDKLESSIFNENYTPSRSQRRKWLNKLRAHITQPPSEEWHEDRDLFYTLKPYTWGSGHKDFCNAKMINVSGDDKEETKALIRQALQTPSVEKDRIAEASKRVSEYKFDASEYPVLAGSEPSVGWQPIDTAPKDGTEILVYESGQYEGYDVEEWDVERCCWKRCDEANPTHWMPIPPNPEGD